MVFLSRWRRFKLLEEEKKKSHKRSGDSTTKVPENLNLCISASLLILICGFMVFCTSQTIKVALFPLNAGTSWQPIRSKPLHVKEERISQHSLYENRVVIRDVVIFPEDILLLIVLPMGCSLASKERLTCIFGSTSSSKVIGLEHGLGRVAVRCQIPPQGLKELQRGVALEQSYGAGAESVLVEMPNLPKGLIAWNLLVFEILVTPTDVVLFAKGIVKKQRRSLPTMNLRCVFDDLVETLVTTAAQEVFRCLHPPLSMQPKLLGKKVTLKVNGTKLPSVAYYESYSAPFSKESQDELFKSHLSSTYKQKKHFLCSCSMIFNGAKFLKEWVVYHAHLGVEKFFLYDNNSEDKLEEAVQMLSSYNVTRRPWPWIKTQEAGFSYCAQQAQEQCSWMMFTDVDEFLFPRFWIPHEAHAAKAATSEFLFPRFWIPHPSHEAQAAKTPTGSPILTTLITETVRKQESNDSMLPKKKVGQVRFNCFNFGPSGRKQHPKEGLMQGYTCRVAKIQHHKSIVFLQAISNSLLNVVHHFNLQSGYQSILLSPEKAVINHYKYQAWEEFKEKFRRRVSAFVADWKESKNLMSMDRTPGLGNRDIKPPDWEHKFCEVNDTALRDYAHNTFGPVVLWQ